LKEELLQKDQERAAQAENHKRQLENHKRQQSSKVIQYMAEKVSSNTADIAMKKESFSTWKGQYQDDKCAHHEARLHVELMREREVFVKTRSDMMVKYFAEKISPAVHDKAMANEGFGIWKEEFMHYRFQMKEGELKKTGLTVAQRNEVEMKKERNLHAKTRGDMVVKYLSEFLTNGTSVVTDMARKKEGWGSWKEQFVHDRFQKHEVKLRNELIRGDWLRHEGVKRHEKEKKIHAKACSDAMIK
jgi:hypothetical protein